MEILSINSVYSKTSSTKNIDEGISDNSTFNIFEKLIDKSKVSEIKSSAYYDNSNISSTSNVTYEKPTQVKWEDHLVYSCLQCSFDPSNIIAEQNMKKNDPISYEWRMQLKIATNGNKYDDAPEFEAFIKKWMEKGETEEQALSRAGAYAFAGLLDYGKQKALQIGGDILPYGYVLPYGDTKQHGFHLINNKPLKNAVIQTLDSLNFEDASTLINSIFDSYPKNSTPTSFQELLNNFGVKLEDLRKKNSETAKDEKFTFTGDINLKDGKEFQEYNNFIFDTLIKFFKEKVNDLDYFVANRPPEENDDFHELKDSLNSLIDNLKKEVDIYNSEK